MTLKFSTNRIYEIIAFATGFSLMVFELVASRILAPTIGSSTYVWTSVIGVIIAALSLGFFFGGWLADKRVARSDIGWLLLGAACCVGVALIFSGGILDTIGSTSWDARIKGLVASMLLFLPASFLLGSISPYLVRLHTESITVAGRSVAFLDALNAIGGIIGTFSAGFVFFSFMGSRQTLVLVIGVLFLSSLLVLPWKLNRTRVAIIVLLGLSVIDAFMPRVNAAHILARIDTPSAHYDVIKTVYNGRDLHALVTGPRGWQSGMYVDAPLELAFSYTRGIADVVEQAPAKDRILMLGGGAFTLPQYWSKTYPDTTIDAVEIDPELVDIATEYFGFNSPPNVTVISDDARAYLGYNKDTYDIIVVDVYSDISVPFALATTEYTKALSTHLRPNGIVIANIIGANNKPCAPLLGALHSAYRANFSQYRAFPMADMSLSTSQNIVAVYGNGSLTWADDTFRSAVLPAGRAPTDNFAPIENLGFSCWAS